MTKLYEAGNHMLICADYDDPAEHRHMAAHIIVSMGSGMQVFSGGRVISCQGIMIPSGMKHRIDTCGKPALVFLFDSTTNISGEIQDIRVLPEKICAGILENYGTMEQDGAYSAFVEKIMTLLGMAHPVCCVPDPRILAAMGLIRQRLSEPLTCGEIAEYVCLSESRFSHLFRQQTGMTFAAYLICQRLMYGYARILSGASITEAALEAGFSSSAHFADVNRRVFGLGASIISKNLAFVHVL